MSKAPSLFDKLMIAKELRFEEGSVELFGNRIVMPPAALFAEYIRRVGNDPKYTDLLYESARISFREGMGKDLKKKFKFNMNDFFNWLPKIATLAGWGVLTIPKFIPERMYGVIECKNSPIVNELKGSVKGPVDHILRGFITAGAETTYGEVADITTIEEECENEGYGACKFVVFDRLSNK